MMFLTEITINETTAVAALSAAFAATLAANAAQWKALQNCQDNRSEELHKLMLTTNDQTLAMSELTRTVGQLVEIMHQGQKSA